MPGRLEVGKALEAPVLDRNGGIAARKLLLAQDYAGHDFLVAQRVGNRDDGGLRDRGMAGKRRLDFQGGDVLAGAADDVLQAVDEVQRAVGPATHRVPGVEPAVAPRMLGRRVVLEVTGKEPAPRIGAGVAHEQLTALFDSQVQIFFRKTYAARADMPWLAARRDHGTAPGLGHRPGFDEREAE